MLFSEYSGPVGVKTEKKMDKPLLFGESSNGGGRRYRLYRRSEAITYGSPYQRAAALVDLVTFFYLFFFPVN